MISVKETRRQQMMEAMRAKPMEPKKLAPTYTENQKILSNLRGALKRQDFDSMGTYLQLLKKDFHIIPTDELASVLTLLLEHQRKFAHVGSAHTLYQALTHLVYRGHVMDCTALCQSMMLIFLKLHEGRHMEELLQFMILNNIAIDHNVIGMLLKQYAKHGPYESAEKLVQYCIDRKLGTKLEYFELLVDAYGKAGKPWEAMQVLKKAEEFHQTIDTVLIRLLYAFAVNGELRGMRNTMKVIRERKIPLTTQIYNMQILGYKKTGKYERALDQYQSMKKMASSNEEVKPDTHTLSMIIDMYAKLGDAESAGEILMDMVAEKKPVYNVYFNSVMDAYRKMGNKAKVLDFYRLMQTTGLYIKDDTYNILLSLYGYEDLDQVRSILDLMHRNRIPLSKTTISIVMKIFYLNKDYEQVRVWYAKLKERGMFPNDVILQTMVRTSLAQGMELEHTLVYYQMAETLKIMNKSLVQDFLLAHLICGTPMNEAISLFMQEMTKYQIDYSIKIVYILLDYILSPSQFATSSLYPVDFMKREESLPKRPGLLEFEKVLKVIQIPDRLHGEIEKAKQYLY
jgi:pentatricopeptide repeat protein